MSTTKTAISWTDRTWNPLRGCTVVSEGCKNCYAMSIAARFNGPGLAFEGYAYKDSHGHAHWTGKVDTFADKLTEPLTWRKPARVFVNSMSDLFHPDVPDEFILAVFAVMAMSPQHIFQVLTKRPERMQEWVSKYRRDKDVRNTVLAARSNKSVPVMACAEGVAAGRLDYSDLHLEGWHWPLPNVWLGTSVENQKWADVRIPHLLQTPAAVRFLSCEPLLGPVDLWTPRYPWPMGRGGLGNAFAWGQGIHWVIVGGESGPDHRPMNLQWARDIRDQCQAAGTAFFFKQSGGLHSETGTTLDGETWHQLPGAA